MNNFLARNHMTKNHMDTIEMWRRFCCYEKLGSICIFTPISHGQQVLLVVFDSKAFIFKKASVDGFASSSITFTEVSSLNHEVFYNSMEKASFVVERFLSSFPNAFLTCAETSEIFTSFGTDVCKQLHHDSADKHIADSNVKEAARALDLDPHDHLEHLENRRYNTVERAALPNHQNEVSFSGGLSVF